jgi:hypothetical protein
MKTVLVQAVQKAGPRGDRDTRPWHPYYDYSIHVLDNGQRPTKKNRVRYVDGYDHFWTTVHPEKAVRKEALDAARRLAHVIGGAVIVAKPRLENARLTRDPGCPRVAG